MAYGTGFAAVEEAINKASQGYARAAHPVDILGPVFVKDGKTVVVRFLSNNIITIPFHDFVTTASGKPKDFVCTTHLEGALRRPCMICDTMTREKDGVQVPLRPREATTVGIVVVKEYDKAARANIDVLREVELLVDPSDPEGAVNKVKAPTFGVIKQGSKFWTTINGYFQKYGTIVDRDYDWSRTGTGLKTAHTIIPNATDEWATAEDLWDHYDIPAIDGFKDPIQGRLVDWIERRGSEEYFDRHLKGIATDSDDDDVADEPTESDTPEWTPSKSKKASAPPSAGESGGTTFASLRDKIGKKYGDG